MTNISRLTSLFVALAVIIGLGLTTAGPTQAAAEVATAQVAQTAQSSDGDSEARGSRSPVAKQKPGKPHGPYITYMGHDYCGGWLSGPAWCLTFSRSEQGYLSAVSLGTATAFICGATAVIACAAAGALAAGAQRYIDRNGICPKSKPKLRVEYFPSPGKASCV